MIEQEYKKRNRRVVCRHNSKNFVFRNECSYCGKLLRRSARNRIGFICKKCGPHSHKPKVDSQNICDDCRFFDECNARVALGLWLRCETPDVADLERLQSVGGLDNEEIRTEVDTALAGRGRRQVLEEKVGESAQVIYQSVPVGSKRQAANLIREHS